MSVLRRWWLRVRIFDAEAKREAFRRHAESAGRQRDAFWLAEAVAAARVRELQDQFRELRRARSA